MKRSVLILLSLLIPASALAQQSEVCVYQATNGKIFQVSSLTEVPRKYRSRAQCIPVSNLAKPQDIKLSGNIRREHISSPLGQVHLRWPRNVEVLFGRTPLRAMTESANTVKKVIQTASFPLRVHNLNLDWQVVFMDESLPEQQIPFRLVSNCHPGWMTPPSNIYIVAQRVAAGCGSRQVKTSVADSQLAEVLIHELGHAVEHHIIPKQFGKNKMRAEGFATWFTQYAAGYSSLINGHRLKQSQFAMARQRPAFRSASDFKGSAVDYARAAMYFHAISERHGARGIMRVYENMNQHSNSFFTAIHREFSWDRKRLESEVVRLLKN